MSYPVLENRKYSISGGWYSPEKYLNDYPSVIKTGLWNTCNSSGDWEGWIVQKIGKRYYLITFSQVNNYPHSGFTLYTGKVISKFDHAPATEDEVYPILQWLDEMFFN